jgi:5-guanidino-2-oxopentanoate decarboxylase
MGLSRGMLHEITDQRALTAPITVLSALAYTPAQIGAHMAHAAALFAAQRPRPVHLSVPIDVLDAPCPPLPRATALPAAAPPDPAAIVEAAAILAAARRPLIVVGGGAKDAGPQIRALAEVLKAPVVSTIAGKGVLPDSHPLSLGATLPRPETRRLVEREADAVLAIGTELSEPDLYVAADSEANSGGLPADTTRLTFADRFIRVDIDPAATVRDCVPSVAIAADASKAAAALAASLYGTTVSSAWDIDLYAQRASLREKASPLERRHLAVLDAVRRALPWDAMIFADMTQLAYTACIFYPVERSRAFMFPAGYGTLGYALPAAIGGALACPDRACAVLVGDGGFLFTAPELAAAVELGLPLPIVLWDNDGFGEIDDLMTARGIPAIGVRPKNPDFAALAGAFGCRLREPRDPAGVETAVVEALAADRPTIIRLRQEAF